MTGGKDKDGLNLLQRAFLVAYREHHNFSKAARTAKCNVSNHYDWLRSNENYVAAFEKAKEEISSKVNDEVLRRAVEGERKLVVFKGKPVFVWVTADGEVVQTRTRGARRVPLYETARSDRMLEISAKAYLPEMFRERTESTINANVNNTGPILYRVELPIRDADDTDLSPSDGTAGNVQQE